MTTQKFHLRYLAFIARPLRRLRGVGNFVILLSLLWVNFVSIRIPVPGFV